MFSNHFWNKILYDAMYPGLMMEEVTENNFIFSLTLKLKMLTESGSLPNRHSAASSFKQTLKKKKKRWMPNCAMEKVKNVSFILNSSTASMLPFRTNYSPQFHHSHLKSVEGARRTRKISFLSMHFFNSPGSLWDELFISPIFKSLLRWKWLFCNDHSCHGASLLTWTLPKWKWKLLRREAP